jgi:hypothetical protein
MTYQQIYQQPEFKDEKIPVPESKPVPTHSSPPPTPVAIKATSVENFFSLRKKYQNEPNSDDPPGRKIPNNMAFELIKEVAILGHSRGFDGDNFVRVCNSSFEKGSDVPANEWLLLRSTTFPYSVLSDGENKSISESLDRIIDRTIMLGLFVVTVYLAFKLRDIEKKVKPTVIVHSRGGDVAVDGAHIDKRQGNFYEGFLEYQGAQAIASSEIESYDVHFSPPDDRHYKPVTFVRIPNSRKYYVFPNTLQYVDDKGFLQAEKNFIHSSNILDNCRSAHMLSYSKSTPSTVVTQKLLKLLGSSSVQVRCVVSDVLSDIPTDQVSEKLVDHLWSEKVAQVQESIIGSLLVIGSHNALSAIHDFVGTFNVKNSLLARVAKQTSPDLLRRVIIKASETNNMSTGQLVHFLSLVDLETSLPLAFQEIKDNKSALAGKLLKEFLIKTYLLHQDNEISVLIHQRLSELVLNEDELVSYRAVEVLCNLFPLHGSIKLLHDAKASSHLKTREYLADHLEKYRTKESLQELRDIARTEKNPIFRKRIKNWLVKHDNWNWRGRFFPKMELDIELPSILLTVILMVRYSLLPVGLFAGALIFIQISFVLEKISNPAMWCTGAIVVFLIPILLLNVIVNDEQEEGMFPKTGCGVFVGAVLLGLFLVVLQKNIPINTIVIKDDFGSINETRWILNEGQDTASRIRGGVLEMEILTPQLTFLSLLETSPLLDFDLIVDCIIPQRTPDNYLYGVVYGYVDSENYYLASISSEGYFWLLEQKQDEYYELEKPLKIKNFSKENNSFRLVAKSGHSLFYMNKDLVLDIKESRAGYVGLAAGAYDEVNVTVHFDNFVLTYIEE